MPGNRLSLTVRVSCQIDLFSLLYFLSQICQNITFASDRNIFGFIVMLHIKAKLTFWQITNMSVAGSNLIV